jgi:curved DNA-binding protein CbpA
LHFGYDMIASQRDGEITYYEALGLEPDASPEQVRDAFRLHVRLLHPDQQTDPQLKEIAESQMRKLNRIHAVLSDPETRRRYDETLNEELAPPVVFSPPVPGFPNLTARLGWAGAIVVSAGLLIWLASDSQPGVQGRATDPPASSATSPTAYSPSLPLSSSLPAHANDQEPFSSEVARLRSDLLAVIVERDAAIRELNKLRRTQPAQNSNAAAIADATDPKPAMTITELPSAARVPLPANSGLPHISPPNNERPANRQLAGFWFYAKPPLGQLNQNQSLYPPEYIEATIMEENGNVRGSLRSRFQIADRAISPDVNFTFMGMRNGAQVSCPWNGAGGAKGEMTLKLTSENSLRIDWMASELGTQQGLNSGTAILTRRIE